MKMTAMTMAMKFLSKSLIPRRYYALAQRYEQGPLTTWTGTRRTTVQKYHISDLLFTSLCVSQRFYFLRLKPCKQKAIKCFSMKLNKYQEPICCYVLAVLRTSKKAFSRSDFSDNSVQVPTLMHSNGRYCIYYCSLPSVSPSSLLKVPNFILKPSAASQFKYKI